MKKKLLSLLFLLIALADCSAFAQTATTFSEEHLYVNEKVAKKSPTNIVLTSNEINSVIKYNVLELIFAEHFSTKTAKVGDKVGFFIKDGLQTEEGTTILPEGSQIEAEVVKIEQPQSFNRCGKVYLSFDKVVLPDGSKIDLNAKIFSKNEYLSRGKLNALAKGMAPTLGAGAAATSLGMSIGYASGATAVIIGGFAIGLPIGLAVGSIAGFCTPGLHFKAKPGDTVLIQLTDNLNINNLEINNL